MLVISAGMQKAGTAYIYNILNDLLIVSGGADARSVKEKYQLQNLMRWSNCNVGRLSFRKLRRLWFLTLKEGTMAVKTHAGPGFWGRLFLKLRMLRIIYIYRDPRDVVLSAFDHGVRMRAAGNHSNFGRLENFEELLKWMQKRVTVWRAYQKCHGVWLVRYEDLISRPVPVVSAIGRYLGIDLALDEIERILEKYHKQDLKEDHKQSLHFNKGIAYRYQEEMSEAEQQRMVAEFGSVLRAMGYES